MTLDVSSLKKLSEGKTKIIYENPKDKETVYMCFKDDITAGDGLKHDVIEGKATVDWKTNKDIFEYLNRCGVRTHYLSSPQPKVSLVKRLQRKINLEVVTRRVAAGSILKWGNVEEGTWYDSPITQFHYKDDLLHDPLLDDDYIDYLIGAKDAFEYVQMREMNPQIFLYLEYAFAYFDVQLVDIKLEYGIIGKEVCLIDEISGGSFRLWPFAKKNPDLKKPNVLSELNPSGRLDKDTYRMGEDFGKVQSKFRRIAGITEKFKDLKI